MNALVRHIPNTLTLLNLVSGLTGITILLTNGNIVDAAYFVGISAILDLLDGAAARALNVKSETGKQLDSLSDIVSFGVLPGLLLVLLIDVSDFGPFFQKLRYTGLFLPIFAAVRLAKFNSNNQQENVFKGLPVPAAGLFFASLPLIYKYDTFGAGYFAVHPITITVSLSVICVLMVSSFRMFSLKFSSFKLRENGIRYLFLGISGGLILVFKYLAVPFIIVLYIVLSLVNRPRKI